MLFAPMMSSLLMRIKLSLGGRHKNEKVDPAETRLCQIQPDVDVANSRTSTEPQKKWIQGWRFRIFGWICITSITLLINIAITIAIAVTSGFQNGLGQLLDGDCTRIQRFNTGAHLLINILSSCLLAGSNCCMQCLSAPTRAEVDRGHAKGIALDIGIPSLRNFKVIKRRRSVIWVLLLLTSLPLHLIYNSVVYASIDYNSFNVIGANEKFLDPGSNLNRSDVQYHNEVMTAQVNALRTQFFNGELERLEPLECVIAYSSDFVSDYGNVVVIPRNNELNRSHVALEYAARAVSNDWLCGSEAELAGCQFRIAEMIDNPDLYFRAFDLHVDHCMAQPTEEECKLYFNLPLAITVIILNATKIVLMFLMARYMDMQPLLTIGDALASFLDRPDTRTRGNCLSSEFKASHPVCGTRPLQWRDERKRWFQSLGWKRWLQFLAPFIIVYFAAILLMGLAMNVLTRTISSRNAFQLGLGSVNSITIFNSFRGAGSIVLANMPQLLLSGTYFAYNVILTIMLTGKEWTELALSQHKGLRVSWQPRGCQRSTYFLQLPYRYSVPLLTVSTILHWLVAEGLYLVAMRSRRQFLNGSPETYLRNWTYRSGLSYSVGWSPLAALLSLVLLTFMLVVMMILAARRYKSGMPLGANNSLVLAAACHPEQQEAGNADISHQKLRWGVSGSFNVPGYKDIGHCTLSDGHVTYPKAWKMYA